jgi:hypothetical protein
MIRRTIFISLSVGLWLIWTSLSLSQETHVIAKSTLVYRPVTNSELEVTIRKAVIKYQEYAPVPRVGFYDLAYPLDKDESKKLQGFGVLLITALSQNPSEFPLKRAYIEFDGTQKELKQLASFMSIIPEKEQKLIKVLGCNRFDALFLLPIYAANRRASLFIDFAVNRKGFKLGSFDPNPGESAKEYDSFPEEFSKNSKEFLTQFIQREYPGIYTYIAKTF